MKRILLFVRLYIQALLLISLLANALTRGPELRGSAHRPRWGGRGPLLQQRRRRLSCQNARPSAKTKRQGLRLRRLAAAVPILRGGCELAHSSTGITSFGWNRTRMATSTLYFDEITEVSVEVVDEVVAELQELPGASMLDRARHLLAALEGLRFTTAEDNASNSPCFPNFPLPSPHLDPIEAHLTDSRQRDSCVLSFIHQDTGDPEQKSGARW